jgi:hypothetical protein
LIDTRATVLSRRCPVHEGGKSEQEGVKEGKYITSNLPRYVVLPSKLVKRCQPL